MYSCCLRIRCSQSSQSKVSESTFCCPAAGKAALYFLQTPLYTPASVKRRETLLHFIFFCSIHLARCEPAATCASRVKTRTGEASRLEAPTVCVIAIVAPKQK